MAASDDMRSSSGTFSKKRLSFGKLLRRASHGLGFSSSGSKSGLGLSPLSSKNQQKAQKAMLTALLDVDEEKCVALYTSIDKVGNSLQFEMHPSLPLGEDENTPMHYAAAGFMPNLLSRFMEHGGSPNTLNAMNQTCIHLACGGFQSRNENSLGFSSGSMVIAVSSVMKEAKSYWEKALSASPGKHVGRGSEGERASSTSSDKDGSDEALAQEHSRRLRCVLLLLEWSGLEIDNVSEQPAVNAVDEQGNTALHYAAACGFSECSDNLIQHNAILTLVNASQQTPCDMAGANGHTDLADALEARMIFGIANSSSNSIAETLSSTGSLSDDENRLLSNAAATAAAEIPEIKESADDFSSLNNAEVIGITEELAQRATKSIAHELDLILHVHIVEHLLNCCKWSENVLLRRLVDDHKQLLRDAKINDALWDSWMRGKTESNMCSANEAVHIVGESASAPADGSLVPSWLRVGIEVLIDVSGTSSSNNVQTSGSTKEITTTEEALNQDAYTMEGRVVEIRSPTLSADSSSFEVSCVVVIAELEEEVDISLNNIKPKPDIQGKSIDPVNDVSSKDQEIPLMEEHSNSPDGKSEKCASSDGEIPLSYALKRLHVCPVCNEEVEEALFICNMGCNHGFCKDCWHGYMRVQMREGGGTNVVCPAYECPLRVDDTIAKSLSDDQQPSVSTFSTMMDTAISYERWQEIRVASIVGQAIDLSFCPGQDCKCVVKRNGNVWRNRTIEPHLANASCSNGHTFCWQCRSEAHSPCPCKLWREWTEAVQEHVSRAKDAASMLRGGQRKRGAAAAAAAIEDETEIKNDLGNLLWLAANTKQCPNCGSPTEKNEGCNHMTCKRCRHEYCWICMKPWSLHSNKTGGYFRCNRFDDDEEDSVKQSASGIGRMRSGSDQDREVSTENRGKGSASEEAKRMAEDAQRTSRFIHHYTRFCAQGQSNEMEQQRKVKTLARIRALQRAIDPENKSMENRESTFSNGEGGGVQKRGVAWRIFASGLTEIQLTGLREFDAAELMQAAFDELAHCRLILRNSYAYAFYVLDQERPENKVTGHRRLQRRVRDTLRARRNDFEGTQSEMEMLTENLSEIVARRYIRATCREIRNATRMATLKRTEFYSTLLRNLAPIVATEKHSGNRKMSEDSFVDLESPRRRARASPRSNGRHSQSSRRRMAVENDGLFIPHDIAITTQDFQQDTRQSQDFHRQSSEDDESLAQLFHSLMQRNDSEQNAGHRDGNMFAAHLHPSSERTDLGVSEPEIDGGGGGDSGGDSGIDVINDRTLMQLLAIQALEASSKTEGNEGNGKTCGSSISHSRAASILLREEELMNQAIIMSLQSSNLDSSAATRSSPLRGSGSNIATNALISELSNTTSDSTLSQGECNEETISTLTIGVDNLPLEYPPSSSSMEVIPLQRQKPLTESIDRPQSHISSNDGKTWTCSVCSIDNNISLLQCSTCNSPKNDPVDGNVYDNSNSGRTTMAEFDRADAAKSTVAASSATIDSSDNESSNNITWVCNRCTLINKRGDEVCIACRQPQQG